MSDSSKLRVGVIGLGKLGLLHAAVANAYPGSRLAGVVDASSNVLSYLKQWKADLTCVNSLDKLLSSTPLDAAIVATPTHLHIPIALELVKRKIPTLIEKPLAISTQQAEPLVQYLDKNPVPTMVGFMSRHVETYRKAKSLLGSGCLGRLSRVQASMYIHQLTSKGSGWRYDRQKSGGGVLITQNSHLLDLLFWMFGPIEWVSAHTEQIFSTTVEDSVHCYLKFSSGLSGWFDASWSQRHYRSLTTCIEVQGERGSLRCSDDEVALYLDEPNGDLKAGWTSFRKPDLYEGVEFDVAGPHYSRQYSEFLTAVREGKDAGSNVYSAYTVQRVVDAIYRSAESQGTSVGLAASA